MLSHRPARIFSLLAAPLMALSACSPDPVAQASSSPSSRAEPSAAAKAQSAALAKREDALLGWLKQTLDKPTHADVYSAAIGQARGRAAHCPTQQCITRALRRREHRLNFAEGNAGDERRARIPFLPFPHGRFTRAEAGYTGPVRIVPLIDGKAMLVIALSFKGRPSCTLDGVMHRDENKQTWTVSSLEEGLPMLVFTPTGKDSFELSYAEAGHQPHSVDYCTTGTGIDGRYTLGS